MKELLDALQRLPISFGMAKRTREQCKRVAERLKDKEHLFILGKGYGEPIALEGALKLKEMAYIHAEGYSGECLWRVGGCMCGRVCEKVWSAACV